MGVLQDKQNHGFSNSVSFNSLHADLSCLLYSWEKTLIQEITYFFENRSLIIKHG